MRAGRQDVDLYKTLCDKLEKYGEVLTPFVADKGITHLGSCFVLGKEMSH